MEYQPPKKRKGSIEINEVVVLVVAIVIAAAFIYAWTQGLPIETQTIPTEFE